MSIIEYGINKVHYAIQTFDPQTGIYTWETPKALKGTISLSKDPVGDITNFYADNVTYFKTVNNDGYSGTLTVALATDTFLKEVYGELEDDNLVKVESSNDIIKQIALGFQIEGDTEGRRIWLANVQLQRPSKEATTKEEAIEPNTYAIEYDAKPLIVSGYVQYSIRRLTGNETIYDEWFDAVYEPTFTP